MWYQCETSRSEAIKLFKTKRSLSIINCIVIIISLLSFLFAYGKKQYGFSMFHFGMKCDKKKKKHREREKRGTFAIPCHLNRICYSHIPTITVSVMTKQKGNLKDKLQIEVLEDLEDNISSPKHLKILLLILL